MDISLLQALHKLHIQKRTCIVIVAEDICKCVSYNGPVGKYSLSALFVFGLIIISCYYCIGKKHCKQSVHEVNCPNESNWLVNNFRPFYKAVWVRIFKQMTFLIKLDLTHILHVKILSEKNVSQVGICQSKVTFYWATAVFYFPVKRVQRTPLEHKRRVF